jgi:predicted nucleic acid-binding protein
MKVLFDTNVILDLLLDRSEFVDDASVLISKVDTNEIDGFLCATTITTIHYLLEKSLNTTQAAKHIKTLLNIFDIAPVSSETLEKALNPKFVDYEDSVLHEAALAVDVDSIVTRDYSGFKNSKIPAYTPKELIAILALNNK